MRLLRSTKTRLVFYLANRDKSVLVKVLGLYPRVPAAHQSLSKTGSLPDPEGTQRLLDEALAEQRQENKQKLQSFLTGPGRFKPNGSGWEFEVLSTELEWLLQVLNDVRVGSWISLGSPEPGRGLPKLTEAAARNFWSMEMAGVFQGILLDAISGARKSV